MLQIIEIKINIINLKTGECLFVKIKMTFKDNKLLIQIKVVKCSKQLIIYRK